MRAGGLAGFGAALVVAAVCVPASAASAAACAPASIPTAKLSTAIELNGVSALSPTNAWAVGISGSGRTSRTLVEHWNGHHWTRVASPGVLTSQSGLIELSAVSARAANDVWAVGERDPTGVEPDGAHSLIEHWNGSAWNIATARIQVEPRREPARHPWVRAGVPGGSVPGGDADLDDRGHRGGQGMVGRVRQGPTRPSRPAPAERGLRLRPGALRFADDVPYRQAELGAHAVRNVRA